MSGLGDLLAWLQGGLQGLGGAVSLRVREEPVLTVGCSALNEGAPVSRLGLVMPGFRRGCGTTGGDPRPPADQWAAAPIVGSVR